MPSHSSAALGSRPLPHPAPILGDKTERAYRRGDASEKRRLLMEDRGRYCLGEAIGKVVRLRPA